MKQLYLTNRLLVLTAGLVLGATYAASAQQTFVPEPFMTTIAGIAAGSGNSICPSTQDIPDAGGNHIGDGCLPTQAQIANMYDVKVDPEGNIYISEGNLTLPNNVVSTNDIRVIYKGGATLTAVLKAANPTIPNFNPIPGRIYTIGGGLNGNLSAVQGIYYCGSVTGSALHATDSLGDGCPAALTRMAPRGLALDQWGNIYFVNATTKYGTRIIYAGDGPNLQVAKLISLLNPTTVPTPQSVQVGYMYQLGFNGVTGAEGDGGIATNAGMIAPRYVTVDSAGNVYIGDGTNATVVGGVATVDDSGENVRMINGTTGIVTTVAGETTCGQSAYNATVGCPVAPTPGLPDGDGGPATSALFNYPTNVFLDQYNNLFIGENTNKRLRVVYRGGTLAPLVAQGITPVVGNIYTYAGGAATSGALGTLRVDGTPAYQIVLNGLNGAGIDKNGNIYFYDSGNRYLWKVDPITGLGNIIAGGPTDTNAPTAGNHCNGSTTGPVSLDSIGSGCPAQQAFVGMIGSISFDNAGDMYFVNTTAITTGNEVVQELSYQNQFPATAVGTPETQYLAFTETAAAPGTVLTGRTFTLQGGADSEYSDAGGTACTATATIAYSAVCVVNVKFNPTRAGVRPGLIQLMSAAGVAGSQVLTGTGTAADIAIDNGTSSTLGSGITPTGVIADLQGNVYVADSKGGQVLKGLATGTTLTPLVTGLKNPAQIAVDNAGNLYIADSGNNRVLITTPAGTTIAAVGTGLSGPQGVAVDAYGGLYVADTGNSRIVTISTEGTQLNYPLAGLTTGLAAPTQLTFDSLGNLYVVDSGNQRLVQYSLSTGVAQPVTLDPGVIPTSVAVDSGGDIYVTDSASKAVIDYSGGVTPGNTLLGSLVTPVGLAIDGDANIFVADSGAAGAQELRRSIGSVVFPLTNLNTTTQASMTVNNVGNGPLTFSMPIDTLTGSTVFSVAPATTNGCGAGIPFAAGGSCNFIDSCSPAVAGTYNATVSFNTNATNTSTAVAQLTCVAKFLVPTTTKLTVSPAPPIYYSTGVTVTVTLTAQPLTVTPTGTFTVVIDGKTQKPLTAVPASGIVNLPLSLATGTHVVTVTYSGDTTYASSNSSLTIVITPAATSTALTVVPLSAGGNAYLSFTATVSVNNQTATGETGTVQVWAGAVGTGTEICAGTIGPNTNYQLVCNNNAAANMINPVSPAPLTYPPNTFIAVYSGSTNGNFTGSQSPVVTTSTSDFVVSPLLTAFTIPQGGVGTLLVNLYTLYGASGIVTPSCTGLPANSNCRFSINTIALAPSTTAVPYVQMQVQVYTDAPSNLARNDMPSIGRGVMLALGLPLGFGLLLVRKRKGLRMLAVLVLGVSMAVGISGCSQPQSTPTFSGLVTPAGTYTVNLTFIGSAGLTTTHSVPATFTVLPAPTVF